MEIKNKLTVTREEKRITGERRGRGKPRKPNRELMGLDNGGMGSTVEVEGDGAGESGRQKMKTTVLEQQ